MFEVIGFIALSRGQQLPNGGRSKRVHRVGIQLQRSFGFLMNLVRPEFHICFHPSIVDVSRASLIETLSSETNGIVTNKAARS